MIEHSRKHGPFDPRYPARRLIADGAAVNESRQHALDREGLLLSVLTTAIWEGEGGAISANGKTRAAVGG